MLRLPLEFRDLLGPVGPILRDSFVGPCWAWALGPFICWAPGPGGVLLGPVICWALLGPFICWALLGPVGAI